MAKLDGLRYEEVKKEYDAWKEKKLSLNMARGKPCDEQLALSTEMLSLPATAEDCIDDGIDTRNYGELTGLPSAKKLFAEILGCRPEQVFIGGSSSLTLMYDTIAKAMTHGLLHSERPWAKEEGLKWLCFVPGYDRHFAITETFGFELVSVPLNADGPDMDRVEELVRDPKVKGMWCVPKYSNPSGIIYSDAVIRRIAALKPAAKDFLLMWDNAYCIHEFDGECAPFPDILTLCEEAGNADMVFEYTSTSKYTFPGAGISCFATSKANMDYMTKLIGYQMICFDKVNQLRHVRFLKDKAHTLELMKRHAAVLKPKFDVVIRTLEKEIAPYEIADWEHPKGGYFVAVAAPHLAKRTWELCKEAGVIMTNAGATNPYGKDPDDCYIRVAPSLPPVADLEKAMQVFCVSLKLAALEREKAS